MNQIPEYLLGTNEYVKVRVTSSADLDDQPVSIHLNGDELPAEWVGDVGPTRVCRTTSTVDFGSVDWTPELYPVQVAFTDTPEAVLLSAGYIRVRA